MHGCDLMINIGARFDDRITGRLADFSPGSRKAHIDIDPSSINKVIRTDMPIIGDVGHVLEDLLALWKARGRKTNREGLAKWWRRSTNGARSTACLQELDRHDQAAIRAPAAGGADPRPWTATSPPRSASTRCGPRSSWASTRPTAG
jgi:acetolactate synthase I/II/III large subunit